MKKIFLSLLALVGVAGGLLCTSCSGGGGKDKEGPSSALTGMTVELWSSVTPSLTIQFLQPISANVCAALYVPGESSVGYSGKFTITQVGKSQLTSQKGKWAVSGDINIADSRIMSDPEFITQLGAGEENISSLERFVVLFYFAEGSKSGDAEVQVEGTYGEDRTPFGNDYPRSATFDIIQGEPHFNFFEDKPYEDKPVVE